MIPPLNDDIRLSVDDYRNKLYELMSNHSHQIHHSRSIPIYKQPTRVVSDTTLTKTRTSPNLTRDVKVNKEKNYTAHSDSKFYNIDSRPKTLPSKQDTRIPTVSRNSFVVPPAKLGQYHRTASCDSSHGSRTEKQKKQLINIKTTSFNSPFNSYSHNHGIITATALRELKTGVR